MRRIDWTALDAAGRKAALARPARRSDPALTDRVRDILADVQARGGAAVTEWSEKLDGARPRRLARRPPLTRPPSPRPAARPAREDVA